MRLRIPSSRKFLLLLLDGLIFYAMYRLILWKRLDVWDIEGFWAWSTGALALYLSCLYIFGTYSFEEIGRLRRLALGVFAAWGTYLLFSLLIIYLARLPVEGLRGRGVLLGGSGLATVGVFITHAAWLFWFRRHQHGRTLLFVGNRQGFEDLKIALKALDFRGTIEIHRDGLLDEQRWDMVVVDRGQMQAVDQAALLHWRFSGGKVSDLSSFYESVFHKVNIDGIDASWFWSYEGFNLLESRLQRRLKRLVDFGLSLFGLILSVPVLLFAAVLIKLDDRGPVFFSQTRTGLDGEDFQIWKLRTMRTDAEKTGAQWAQKNDSRITRIGGFLRKTRLDELPQLWNVLKGEMSFVGPRPERPEFNSMLEEKIPFYGARHLMPPGITGWAQILYPYGASVEDSKQKLQYDLFYIKNHSLILDLRIIVKTIQVVVFGKGR